MNLVIQRSSRGERLEISYLYEARSDDICVENTHFKLDPIRYLHLGSVSFKIVWRVEAESFPYIASDFALQFC